MKLEDVTVEQFAKWSFERDIKERKIWNIEEEDDPQTWEELDWDEKQSYLEEAQYYIEEHDKEDWPVDILKRLEFKG